jgi:hypothetical protein
MQYRAILLPKLGEKAEQVFCASREEAERWARKTLWARHRGLVQAAEKGQAPRELTGPRVEIHETKLVGVTTVYPWDVGESDKREESAG